MKKIISIIAEEIFIAENKKINDIKLKQIITNNITENVNNRNQVISEAILFYKNLFLQLNDNYYSFISQPLLEVCYSIKLSEDISNKNFVLDINTNTWRPYSFAIAINKLKNGLTENLNDTIIKSLDELLIYESNIPIAAIVISESKSKVVAKHFINKMSIMSFRPLRTWNKGGMWGAPDTYSSFVIAEAINISGSEGLAWFMEEYLNPKHPISHYEESIIKAILGNLFYINKFNVDDRNKEKLLKIFNHHIEAQTLSCQYFLPIICLVIPDKITIENKSIMLLQLLPERIFSDKCKELINKEIRNGNEDFIINAIEKIAAKESSKNEEAILLYFDLYKEKNHFNKAIINKLITLSVNGETTLQKKAI